MAGNRQRSYSLDVSVYYTKLDYTPSKRKVSQEVAISNTISEYYPSKLNGTRYIRINGKITHKCKYNKGKPKDIKAHNDLIYAIHQQYITYNPNYDILTFPIQYQYWTKGARSMTV